ncbi:MAG: sacsin N-terminal ATP-binding-like domain-containing protein [Actinoallomurus sp.]
MEDPYGTVAIRERVLAAWSASPARFREDANAEEDHARGGYRDRVIIELAQNAADAAARAGVPGRIRFALRDGVLTAANTGAPLDAPGVEALSTLRASAKRDETDATGRFGVGFAAVVAVSDEPSIVSRPDRGVAWSAAGTRRAVAEIPALGEELGRRSGDVPLLRLPFPADGAAEVPEGFDTLVRLPLRDDAAEALVRRLLDETGPALLLALPALTEIVIDAGDAPRTLTASWARTGEGPGGTVTIDGSAWRTAEAHGLADASLLADRPVEERAGWQVRWAIPEDATLPPGVHSVIHAPTPSDEPLGLPALLIASFPLAPDRRHVAPGPLTDFLLERAAETYVELLPHAPRLLDLVPGPMAKGELDARLRRSILARLPDTPLVPLPVPPSEADTIIGDDPAELAVDTGGTILVRGRDAVAVDGPPGLPVVLAEAVPGLLPPDWPARHPALAALGVRRLSVVEVVDALAALETGDPAWWRRLYAALEGADREALTGLPVPLADGRTVRGPRGLLMTDPEGLDALGLRIVHPEAAHPLLLRLGAVEAGPRGVLTDAATRAAVAASYDEEDPEPIWDAVLTLVARAHLRPGEEPWLAELALPGDDGEVYAAGELLLPGAPLGAVVVDDAPFGVVDAGLVERHGAATLEAAGVLRTFALLRAEDLIEPAHHLDGEEEWADELGDGFVVPEFTAVRDLELVADWEGAFALLAEPPLRSALTDPVRVILADGRQATVPSYTAWWLRRHPVLDGRRPGSLCVPGDLDGLYDRAPAGLDSQVVRALGVRTTLDALLGEPEGAAELLDRLADPSRTVSRERLRSLWRALSVADLDMAAPEYVRAFVDGEPEVVPAGDAIVVDRPDLLPLLAGQPLLFVPVELADALELTLGSEEVPGVITSPGAVRDVPAVLRTVLPGAPASYAHHDRLVVDGEEVPWWYADGMVHASGVFGLARGAAWACGRWGDRLLAEAVLRSPEDLPSLLAEAELA